MSEALIPIYVPAMKSIYNVKSTDLLAKIEALRKHEDILFRYFHILTPKEEEAVREALQKKSV